MSISKEDAALRVARTGREPAHVGAIISADPGRTDTHAIDVHAGSYVVPADVVAGLGENNTLAGMKILDRMFKATPYTVAGPTPYRSPIAPPAGSSIAAPTSLTTMANGGAAKQVGIVAAGGEYVIGPDKVTEIGSGDMDRGHKILDAFVKKVRKDHIKTLSKLPSPAKS